MAFWCILTLGTRISKSCCYKNVGSVEGALLRQLSSWLHGDNLLGFVTDGREKQLFKASLIIPELGHECSLLI